MRCKESGSCSSSLVNRSYVAMLYLLSLYFAGICHSNVVVISKRLASVADLAILFIDELVTSVMSITF